MRHFDCTWIDQDGRVVVWRVPRYQSLERYKRKVWSPLVVFNHKEYLGRWNEQVYRNPLDRGPGTSPFYFAKGPAPK